MRPTLRFFAGFGLKSGSEASSAPWRAAPPVTVKRAAPAPVSAATLKHRSLQPLPHDPPTQAAFALVRQLLEERPRHFREILTAGVERLPVERSEGAEAKVEEEPEAVAQPQGKGKKGKGKAKLPPPRKEGMDVPDGHPFVSGTFLKKRILRVLESQRLITKRWLPADAGSILIRGTSNTDKLWAKWELRDDASTKSRWERLILSPVNERVLSELGAEAARELEAEKRTEREARFAAREATRTEREIWEWDERPKGITTPLERTHLNKRRSRARPAKEERRAAYEAEREEAEEAARAAVAKEAAQH